MLGLPLSVAVFSYVLASLNSVVQGVAPVNSIPVKVSAETQRGDGALS